MVICASYAHPQGNFELHGLISIYLSTSGVCLYPFLGVLSIIMHVYMGEMQGLHEVAIDANIKHVIKNNIVNNMVTY